MSDTTSVRGFGSSTVRSASDDLAGEAMGDNSAYIQIRNLTKRYGGTAAVDDLDLDISEGEFLVLLGPSGCGKTTTMRSIVGLEQPDVGKIHVRGQCVYDTSQKINVPANKRGIGMVFQSYAIWPHRTVYENVVFPLKMQKVPSSDAKHHVMEVLEMVGMDHLADRGASALSGGQMQRVALARSIAMQPSVLLLDEPLSNLDAKLREHLRVELKEIQQRLGITTVYVTHDQSEALALADRIAVMRAGVIEQLGSAVDIYRNPASRFVAEFLGSSNLVPGEIAESSSGVAIEPGFHVPIPEDIHLPDGAAVHVSVRPEEIDVVSSERAEASATVEVVNFLGAHVQYMVETSGGTRLTILEPGVGKIHHPGDVVHLAFKRDSVRVFTDAY